jgi:hypothetical protein
MILVKFLLVVLGIYFAFFLFFRVFGKAISRFALSYLQRKAQASMDAQSRAFQQKAEGHSPYEDSVFVKDDVKVSIPKSQQNKPKKDHTFDPNRIEQVEYEDLE